MLEPIFQFALPIIGRIERHISRVLISGTDTRFQTDWVSRHETIWAKYMRPWRGAANVQMLEIGSKEGRSALWFLQNILTHPSAAITCVDIFYHREIEVNFEHNVQVAGVGSRVIKIKGKSQEVLRVLRQNFYDLIYVDGGHRADDVYADALLGWPLLKAGGLMIFDDYLWNLKEPPEERPQMGVDRFIEEHREQLSLLHQDYQVIIQKHASQESTVLEDVTTETSDEHN